MLDIVSGYYRIQFQRKRMIQTQENDKKTHFGLIYARWPQTWSIHHFFSKFWLWKLIDIMVSCHCVQYKENLMIQS